MEGLSSPSICYSRKENGAVCGISLWNRGDTAWTKYYFVKNLQGDVLAVYQYGSSFTKVAEYTYDSWGNVLTATGALANINPFRYRSYYRDADTGFYYLQSRYYDPAIGRFINADSFASTGQDFLGYNMFAYCRNNPSSRKDVHGRADEDAAEEARQGLSTLLDTYATISEFGFSIDIESETASWDASIKKLGIQEAYDYMSDYLCQKYNDAYGEEFLFSNKCVSYEIEYHVDAYMCMMRYKGYWRSITTLIRSRDNLIAHCKSVDISTNDIGNSPQELMFDYKGGIRDCYKFTDRDPYAKRKKFICWEFYVR